jgi:hypothetical protein
VARSGRAAKRYLNKPSDEHGQPLDAAEADLEAVARTFGRTAAALSICASARS